MLTQHARCLPSLIFGGDHWRIQEFCLGAKNSDGLFAIFIYPWGVSNKNGWGPWPDWSRLDSPLAVGGDARIKDATGYARHALKKTDWLIKRLSAR